MQFFKPLNDDGDLLLKNRIKYFNALFVISAITVGFYILKYNFQYKFYYYNWQLIPPYLLYLATPLIYRRTQNLLLTEILLYTIPSLELIFLVWTAGGMQAPGVFWLSAVPLTAGIFFGRYGNFIGAATVLLAVAFYYTCDYWGMSPNFIRDLNIYDVEKRMNTLFFLAYSATVTHYFVTAEEKMIGEIQDSKQEVENLLRILIHDVATPLTVVQMEAFRLKKKVEQPDLLTSVSRIERSTENLNAILAQIREFKSLKDGKVFLKPHPIHINALIHEAIDQLKVRLEDKNMRIELSMPSEDVYIEGASVPFRNIIVMNLLTNAIKFSPEGSKIDLTVSKNQAEIVLKVRDYGLGIPPHILENLFSMSAQTSRLGTRGEKGTGYGMPLVKEYVQKMHGRIEVVSNEVAGVNQLQGTEVTLRFPLGQKG